MSAILNMNEMPYFSWKGKTFTQITSIIKKNAMSNIDSKHSIFMPTPLKLYRREIVSSNDVSYNCNTRKSSSINLFDMPGGTIVNSSLVTNALTNTLDINLTSNNYERLGTCQTDIKNCMSQVTNARRRVRSSGMIRKQFDLTKNNDIDYHTSTNQYLVSRNKTFQQNQYYYIRQGNATTNAGSLSNDNVYSPHGLNHCKKYYISTDTSFGYQWVDRKYYQVDIPAGNYTVDEINTLFQRIMTNNKHYFIEKETGSYVYLLNISYIYTVNKIELKSLKTNLDIFNSINYSFPLNNENNEITDWEKYLYLYDIKGTGVRTTIWPVFVILNNSFNTAIGFNSSISSVSDVVNGNDLIVQSDVNTNVFYPSNIIKQQTEEVNHQQYSIDEGDLTSVSSYSPQLKPSYIQTYYKPNNPQFAQQGAVSASSHTARERYNSITNNTAKYRNAYGLSVANALAYGVPENGYTIKDKIGYPNKQTPVFSKYSNEVTCKMKTIARK